MKKVYLFLLAMLLMACSLSKTFTSSISPTETIEPTQTLKPTDTPVPMTDDEFNELAQGSCEELKNELSDIADSSTSFIERYGMAAEAYQHTKDDLSDISTDAASAPLATDFLTNLTQLPGLFEDYGQALENALSEFSLSYSDISYYAVTTEDKAFMIFANDKWHELIVEEELKMSFYTTRSKFDYSANQLGLNACTAVNPIFD